MGDGPPKFEVWDLTPPGTTCMFLAAVASGALWPGLAEFGRGPAWGLGWGLGRESADLGPHTETAWAWTSVPSGPGPVCWAPRGLDARSPLGPRSGSPKRLSSFPEPPVPAA